MARIRGLHQSIRLALGSLILTACTSGGGTTTPHTVTSVSVTPATVSVAAGGTTQLSATPKDAGGSAVGGQTVTWSSANSAVASVSASGLVTGVAAGGPVLISATAAGFTGSANVTVTPPPVASVSVTPPTTTLSQGASSQFTATPKDAGGNALSGRTVTWASSNTSLANVSTAGLVTGVAVGGPVTITATSEGINGTATVTVIAAPVTQVSVTPAAPIVLQGATAQLVATPKDASGNALSGKTVTWASSNSAIASVSATGLVTGVAVGGPVTITATVDGINGTASVTVTPPSFNAAWHLRRQITVTTGSASIPAGYSVPVQFDHAALVSAAKAVASGYDVRVAWWSGTAWQELDRVLDSGSGWNSSTTTLWFKTQAAIAANSADNNYFLYYSSAAVVPPPATASNVFLFADDFEQQNFNKWLADGPSLWQIDNSRSHTGSYSAMYPTEGGGFHNLYATPNVNVADVYVEAWWNINALSQKWNVSQFLRTTVSEDSYGTLLCSCSLNNVGPIGWNISKNVGGVYSDINAPAGTIVANSWMRVGTAIAGSTYQVFLNGTLINTASGMTPLTAAGNIGIGKGVTPTSSIPPGIVWVDDVIVRRYAIPEPTTALGSEQPAP